MCCAAWPHFHIICMHVGSVAVDVKAASDELTVAVLSTVVFGTEPIAALTGEVCVRRNASLV